MVAISTGFKTSAIPWAGGSVAEVMKTTTLRPRTLSALVLAGAIPNLLAALVVGGLSIGALSTIDGRAWALAHELHAGTLEPEAITEFARWVRRIVVASLATMVLLVSVTLDALVSAARQLERRIGFARDFVAARADGAHPEPLMSSSSCAIGELEAQLDRLARVLDARDVALEAEIEHNRFEGQMQRALELADSEADVMDVTLRGLAEAVPDHAVELLLADSSQAHLRRAIATPTLATGGCSVQSPVTVPLSARGAHCASPTPRPSTPDPSCADAPVAAARGCARR